ncbi:hypothetical protein IMG5_199420 [Ichthyophthirius multifiliis]|uniref:Kinesin motor domain-containing protein n=1 Tax=Ichthyophthirius multifiliis TaxID=5932 RepID=G0R5K2_ICHMU|nr:hypothetical protein IMG5_199420 [Ichthyophthirius multifiliis]EGR27262.1 hypothetical protein IMG5_199420 [Ichthyophthirius multifiliis]|eukprot:XP_004024146.1 hypothetical protein IMG5_199420 [Ichthyophthirius multifiliis]
MKTKIKYSTNIQNNNNKIVQGNIRVFCRIRPLLDDEILDKTLEMINVQNQNTLKLQVPQSQMKSSNNLKDYQFNFMHIFDQNSSQKDVFDQLNFFISTAIHGYNVCIFSYGPTGSGKTYTMYGREENIEQQGIIPRSIIQTINQILEIQKKDNNIDIEISLIEIYNEEYKDLIEEKKCQKKEEIQFLPIKIKENSAQKILQIIKIALQNRKLRIYLIC